MPSGLPGQVSAADGVLVLFVRERVMKSILRIALLVCGLLISLGVVYIGIEGIAQPIHGTPIVQAAAMVIIGGACTLGVLLSLIVPRWLSSAVTLRRGIICAAFALPTIDIFALWQSPALLGHVATSALVSSIVAFSISTAWLRPFSADH
jgi:hypothetical protein